MKNYKLAYEKALDALKQISYDGPASAARTAVDGMVDAHLALDEPITEVKPNVTPNYSRQACKDSF